MRRYKTCIFFLADGARADLFEEKLSRGVLPNISRYIVEPGSYRRGTTVFPSTTGPAYLPMLTGCYPGPCNIPGIRWFDRKEYARSPFSTRRFRSYVGYESFLINRDIAPGISTMFELSERSANIFSGINRGVSYRGNRTKWLRMLYFYYAHLTDHWAFVDREAVQKLLHTLDDDPDFVFVVLPAIDEYSHLSDPFGPQTRQAYQEMDRLIGLVVQKLKKLGRLEDTAMFISSDHGLSATKKHFGVDQFLENKGVKTFYYPMVFKRNFSAATMVSGNGMCHVYLRNNGTWGQGINFDQMSDDALNLPAQLVDREEVDLVAARGANGEVFVVSKRGKAKITKRDGQYFYDALDGNPLGYSEVPSDGIEERATLDHTFNTDYPDGIVQLHQIFDSPRTGDLIISAKPGYDLRDRFESPEHRASHGSLHREHMHVPVVSGVPLQSGPVRTVDFFPIMLDCLGREPKGPINGVNRRI